MLSENIKHYRKVKKVGAPKTMETEENTLKRNNSMCSEYNLLAKAFYTYNILFHLNS